MDTLVALGSAASFVYSTYALVCHDRTHRSEGDMDAVMNYMMDFYFESAAMILDADHRRERCWRRIPKARPQTH